jgi:hypothetical protein
MIRNVTKRPDDSQKPMGGYAWAPLFAIRMAISKTEAETWTDASFGGDQAFNNLARLIKSEIVANPGKLPLVKMNGTQTKSLKNRDAVIPTAGRTEEFA